MTRVLAIPAAWLVAAAAAAAAAPPEVTIVLAEHTAPYLEAAQAVGERLAGRAHVTATEADRVEATALRQPAAVVALGTRALHVVLASATHAPVIATLVPRSAFDAELKAVPAQRRARAVTAVYLDQPFERQLDLVRVLTPEKTRIGLLSSADSRDAVAQIETAARARGLSIANGEVFDGYGISAPLERVLDKSDLLLALPDPSIFNANTIHNILLSTLRAQQPLIGFSEAYVRAGALAAVYSKPGQVGSQAGEIAARVISGAPLPPPQYPKAFSVSVNPRVARSLGLALDEEEAIVARLQQLERGP